MTPHRLADKLAALLPADWPQRSELLQLAKSIDADHRDAAPSLWSRADDRLIPLRAAVLAVARAREERQ